jgi:hypothetical protein
MHAPIHSSRLSIKGGLMLAVALWFGANLALYALLATSIKHTARLPEAPALGLLDATTEAALPTVEAVGFHMDWGFEPADFTPGARPFIGAQGQVKGFSAGLAGKNASLSVMTVPGHPPSVKDALRALCGLEPSRFARFRDSYLSGLDEFSPWNLPCNLTLAGRLLNRDKNMPWAKKTVTLTRVQTPMGEGLMVEAGRPQDGLTVALAFSAPLPGGGALTIRAERLDAHTREAVLALLRSLRPARGRGVGLTPVALIEMGYPRELAATIALVGPETREPMDARIRAELQGLEAGSALAEYLTQALARIASPSP